jgi:hypothetical protein
MGTDSARRLLHAAIILRGLALSFLGAGLGAALAVRGC